MEEDPRFAECVAFVGGPDVCLELDALEKWAGWLARKVEERRKVRTEGARTAWRAFISESLKKGAKELHAVVQRQETFQGESVGEGTGRTGQPQAIVDAERIAWAKIWQNFKGSCDAPCRDADLSADEALPWQTVAEVRRCARRFKATTAVGWDSFVPRWISWLSDDLLGCVIDVFVLIESVGSWPKGIGCSLVHFIPKQAGGRRPIGVLATFIRIWEVMRKPVIWSWRTAIARPFNWAATGRSAESGVWGQSVKDEAARGTRAALRSSAVRLGQSL